MMFSSVLSVSFLYGMLMVPGMVPRSTHFSVRESMTRMLSSPLETLSR